MFNSFIDVMIIKDGIHTLVDRIIVDPTGVDLFPWSYTTQKFVIFNAAQAQKKSYCNWHPIDQFLLLEIEVFGWRAPKFLVRPKKGPTMLKSGNSWNLVLLPSSSTKGGERGVLKAPRLD